MRGIINCNNLNYISSSFDKPNQMHLAMQIFTYLLRCNPYCLRLRKIQSLIVGYASIF